MKTLTLTVVLTLVLHSLASGNIQQQRGAPPAPSPTPKTVIRGGENGLSPESTLFKNLLFADESIEKFLGHAKLDGTVANEEPWRSFALHVAHSKEGKVEEAKKDLKRVLALPDAETRILLLAWTALRALGERPPRDVADKVLGVICELHGDVGVGTLAAYADGRVRWVGGQRAGGIWDAPGSSKEMDSAIAEVLKSAGPLVNRARAVERHDSTEVKMDHFRVTILTPGGIHVIDVYGPDIDNAAHYLAPTLLTSTALLAALDKHQQKQRQ